MSIASRAGPALAPFAVCLLLLACAPPATSPTEPTPPPSVFSVDAETLRRADRHFYARRCREAEPLYRELYGQMRSAGDLDDSQRRVASQLGKTYLLLEDYPAALAPLQWALAVQQADGLGVAPLYKLPGTGLPPTAALPGAECEALAVARILGAGALVGAQARETEIVRRMAQQRVIHLATHGFLDLDSGLKEFGLSVDPTAPTAADTGVHATPGAGDRR